MKPKYRVRCLYGEFVVEQRYRFRWRVIRDGLVDSDQAADFVRSVANARLFAADGREITQQKERS